jgi:hypothetical protein
MKWNLPPLLAWTRARKRPVTSPNTKKLNHHAVWELAFASLSIR